MTTLIDASLKLQSMMNTEKERRGRWKDFLNNKFGQQSIILSLSAKYLWILQEARDGYLLDRGGDLEVATD